MVKTKKIVKRKFKKDVIIDIPRKKLVHGSAGKGNYALMYKASGKMKAHPYISDEPEELSEEFSKLAGICISGYLETRNKKKKELMLKFDEHTMNNVASLLLVWADLKGEKEVFEYLKEEIKGDDETLLATLKYLHAMDKKRKK